MYKKLQGGGQIQPPPLAGIGLRDTPVTEENFRFTLVPLKNLKKTESERFVFTNIVQI